jgi:pyruvate,water dikinase
MYICAIAPPPEEIIGEKAGHFEKRVFYVFEHYNELWDKWLTKFKALGEEMAAVKVPAELPKFVPEDQVLPAPTGVYDSYYLIESFDRLVNQMFKGWQYHFEMLNLTYLAYLMFADVARKLFPGISESAIGKMVAGAYVSMFKPEEELCRLSKMAASAKEVSAILKSDKSVEDKVADLQKSENGKKWLAEYEKAKDPWFYVSCGSGWFHYEGSWLTDPSIPYSYIKGYVERLENGENIERSLDEIEKQRDEIVAEYRKLIKTDDDRKAFDDAYNTVRTIYTYAEDHLFWVEHWFHTIWFDKIREFGKLLVNNDMLNEVDDIFMFNRYEIPQLLTEVSTGWALGVDIPMRGSFYKAKAEKRKKILEAAGNWNPIPALGVPPEEVAEPFTIMLWGITTDKVKEWLKGVDATAGKDVSEIKGFASSAGIVEGPARVLKRLKDIVDLQPGEILVCPSTNPSWAPVFTKIKAAVTDIGGLTSHAAIVCREYGVPSVTGTGVSTQVIKTGDTIKVDGDTGVVEIVKRAG